MTQSKAWMETARIWAEGKMPEGWDRKDGIFIGIFYNHMLDFIANNFVLTPKY